MVNEHFPDKADAIRAYKTKQPTPLQAAPFYVGLLSYFEAARRLEKRSLLMVNEHFPDKADAIRTYKTKQPTPLQAAPFCVGLLSYFEAARRV